MLDNLEKTEMLESGSGFGLETIQIQCPYCWEKSGIVVDTSVDQQQYIEDCEVCCNPIELTVQYSEGELSSFEANNIEQ